MNHVLCAPWHSAVELKLCFKPATRIIVIVVLLLVMINQPIELLNVDALS
jgi:hypothetical protein